MKIIHVSDTHLGFSAYKKVTDDGINQRELDIYNSFKKFIDHLVKTKPDIVIHAGDLFDSVRPTNKAISFAVDQINRLSKEKIPFVVISGNHETPKLKETENIFKIFEHMDNVYPIYNNKYEKINFEFNDKNITIHAIPHCQTKDSFNKNLKKIKKNKDANYNILLIHGAITGIKEFKMNEFNELIIPKKVLNLDFDYIALGHYHKYTKIANNVFYSGSTERLSFSETEEEKGFIELDLVKTKNKFIKLKTREMKNLANIDCKNKGIEEITREIKKTIKNTNTKDKILRLKIDNIPKYVQRGINYSEIKKLTKEAAHFEIKLDVLKIKNDEKMENHKIESIANEFEKFLLNENIKDKEMILNLGLEYIKKLEIKS